MDFPQSSSKSNPGLCLHCPCALPWEFPLLCRRRYVTKPTSDEEDDGEEKGEGEEGERDNKDKGLHMCPMA